MTDTSRSLFLPNCLWIDLINQVSLRNIGCIDCFPPEAVGSGRLRIAFILVKLKMNAISKLHLLHLQWFTRRSTSDRNLPHWVDPLRTTIKNQYDLLSNKIIAENGDILFLFYNTNFFAVRWTSDDYALSVYTGRSVMCLSILMQLNYKNYLERRTHYHIEHLTLFEILRIAETNLCPFPLFVLA